LESLGTRFHSTPSGEAAPNTVKTLWDEAAQGKIPGFSTESFETPDSRQNSVIAAIPGSRDDQTTVILGAHLDSINRAGSTEAAPGADDDGTGIATLVEIIRSIAQSGARFERRVELHAYAAEEIGLEGSIAVARKYAADGRKIAGMMQFDMNGWSKNQDDIIHFVTTTTTAYLTRAAKDLANTYLGGRFTSAALNAGTSDHKSWYLRGYPVVFPFENPVAYNPAMHTQNDTVSGLNSLGLAQRMARLGLAFLAHEAGLVVAGDKDATSAAALAKTRASLKSDLKVAVIPKTDSQDAYVTIATGLSTIKTVEICRTGAKGAMACTHQRLGTVQGESRQNRTFYQVDLPLKISSGDRLAIFGYDQGEAIVAQRTIRVTAR
jgi:leucyl aminopeptidase